MFDITQQNRRSHRRFAMRRLCKLYDPRSGRLFAGETVDLSETSTLVCIPRRVGLKVGDPVLIALSMMDRQGLVQPKDMIEATVTRRLETENGDTHIAVRYVRAPVSDHCSLACTSTEPAPLAA